MTSCRNEPPALIFGTGITALGVIRGLARAGVKTYCASPQANFVGRSRWYRPVPNTHHPIFHSGNLEQYLERLPFSQAVLIPCTDDRVLATARLTGKLKDRFPSCQSSVTTLRSLIDKGELQKVLIKHRLPHPKTMLLTSEEDLYLIPADLLVNSFLKPRASQIFFKHYGLKAFWITSLDEAIGRYREFKAKSLEVVLQEYIPGPPTNHYFVDGFVDRTGRICATFARRRIRMYPPDFGNSSYLTSIPSQDVAGAVETLRRLFSAVDYRGVYSAEFKFDLRDGQYKLLEVNVRPWWYIEFADWCGIPIAFMAYQDALGRDVEPVVTYKVGANLVYPAYDFYACLELHRQGNLNIASWAKSWLTAKSAIFAWRDPLPSLTATVDGFRRRLKSTYLSLKRGESPQ